MKKSLIYSGLLIPLFTVSFYLQAEDLRPIGDLALGFVKQKAFQGILHVQERNKYSQFSWPNEPSTVKQFNRENNIVQSAANDVQLASDFIKNALNTLKKLSDKESKAELEYIEPIAAEIEKYKNILNAHKSSKK